MATRRTQKDGKQSTESRFSMLESRLGHRFARPELLELALTHRSFSYESRGLDERAATNTPEPGADNEQMEFLGDAVLGLAVAEALYRQFPQCTEGELTMLRAGLVSGKRMGAVGGQLGLGEFLLLGRTAEHGNGRLKPTLLANAAEAVIAAVYLDAGFEAARKLVEAAVIAPAIEEMRAALAGTSGALRDPKTLLQERVQATGAGKLRYVDAGETGLPHQRRFSVEAQIEDMAGVRVLSSAEGASKKEAQQRAAELALERWSAAVVEGAA